MSDILLKAKEALLMSQNVSTLLQEIIVLEEEAGGYYVSPTGNDANSGLINSPWKTIQKAADNVNPGDRVHIMPGTYFERVLLKISGTSDAYIKFISDNATLDGTGIDLYAARKALFDTNGKSFVVIEGLRVINADYFGIGDMAGETSGGHDIIVRNCRTYNTGSSGIAFFWGASMTISNNVVEYSNTRSTQEAISLHGIQGFTINGNEVFNGLMEGIDCKGGSSNGKIFDNYVHDLVAGPYKMNGIYIDAYDREGSNIEVYNNLVERCGNGIIVAAENNGSCHDIYIHNNTIKFCRAGFNVSGWGIGSTHMVHDIIFDHNEIYGASDNAITFSNASAINIRLTNNRLGGQYTYTDAIEMTNKVTSVDPSVFIDGNALCKLGTKPTALNGTNYTILPALDVP